MGNTENKRNKNSRHKLGIGVQSFVKLIKENFIYVDKTKYIHDLITRGTNYFLARPRRFGKSLLISTLKEIFEGNKELFENYWIHDKIDWQHYKVIHLDFLQVDYQSYGLEKAIDKSLNDIAKKFQIQLKKESIKEKFIELIEKLSTEKEVVILIDEYDKPIIDYIEDTNKAEANREILKNFYSVVKSLDRHIKFLLITGVSKFSKVSVFSDLNNLNDISSHPRYMKILGYTIDEIQSYFKNHIAEWVDSEPIKPETLMANLKEYYDGYSWDGKTYLYNPYSILNCLDKMAFKNYWFATGTPTFLVNMTRKANIPVHKLENVPVSESFFEKFNIRDIDVMALLFQTGYLSIKRFDGQTYFLSYPNREVRMSFLQNLLEGYSFKKLNETEELKSTIKQALSEQNTDRLIRSFKTLFSSIPYDLAIPQLEAYYHSLLYAALKLSMTDVACEVHTNKGRIDLLIREGNYIYIIELKMRSAQEALQQIESRKYYEPYLDTPGIKNVILIGIGLDKESRNISGCEIKIL